MKKHKFSPAGIKKYCTVFTIIPALCSPLNIFSQWSADPAVNTPVCTSVKNQKNLSITSDSKNGAVIAWTDYRNNDIAASIYIQRLNSQGYPVWPLDGIPVSPSAADQTNPTTEADTDGNIYIAWDDSLTGTRDIFAQKFDSSGNPKWAQGGVPVVVKQGNQSNIKIISDGSGGIIAVWEDDSGTDWDIYAQRISATGVQLWTASGVAVCTSPFNQKNPKIVDDGTGGAYIVWQDKRNGIDLDIYAQHINSSGNMLLAANGIIVCNAPDKQRSEKIVSDGLGGCIIVWEDQRTGIHYDVYAQRINSAGTLMWQSNGVAVCTADSSQTSIDITSENINGVIVTWRDKRNGLYHDIYAQKINLNGTAAWALNGVAVSTDNLIQTYPNICGDQAGGAIIVWQDSSSADWNIKSSRVDASGNVLWNYQGNNVSIATLNQINPKNISDGKGGSIYVWMDLRNGQDYDIYSHHLFANGAENSVPLNNSPVSPVSVFPNPSNNKLFVKIHESRILDNITISVKDIYGNEIFSLRPESRFFVIEHENLSPGIYFLTTSDENINVSTIKIILSGN